jgi:SsrA-binding protein
MALLVNKKAHHEFEIERRLVAGIVLTGQEVKSLRLKHGSLTGSYVKILSGEAFLVNAQINHYTFANDPDYDPKRTRKLLLQKKEIYNLTEVSQQKGWGVVPLAITFEHRLIKVEIGVGKGKKTYEKRAELKRKDQDRADKRAVRDALRK